MRIVYSATVCLLVIVLAVGLFQCVCAATTTTTSDPRCAKHTCAAPLDVNYTALGHKPMDPTTCSGETCPKCLVGPEWDARRASLGFGNATRYITFSLNFGDWLSAETSGTIFRILTEEMMGFELDTLPLWIEARDVLCCVERDLIYLEAWPADNDPNDDGYFSLSQLSMGYEGGVRLWVGQNTVEEFPLATAYSAYKFLPEYSNIFDKAGETPCELGIEDKALGCTDGNYKCDYQQWANTSCQEKGRYVPPRCQGENMKYCQEILSMWPTNEPGFFESLIKNNELNFTIFYVGYANLVPRVLQLQRENKHAMFYGWEPDPMIPLLNAKPVVFPTPTAECKAKQTSDPSTSKGDCDSTQILLKKVARRASLAKDLDFKHFFDAFTITGTEMYNMLKRHKSGGGDMSVYNVSCNWIKENYGQWESWIRNTPDVVENTTAIYITSSDDKELGSHVLIPAVAAPVAAIFILICIFIIIRRMQIRAMIKHAPRKPPLALIFTDVESSTSLWERFGADMAVAMELHHKIIRELIEEHQCYEVKTIGDAFMIACPTLVDATMLSVAIQRHLHAAEWPEKLRHWKKLTSEAEEGPREQWNGLRVRIGIHHCVECEPRFDGVHGRYDYYGHDVNISARVEGMAQGGQILMIADTHAKLLEDADFAMIIGDDAHFVKFAADVELKGISESVLVYSCTPSNLSKRRFNPIGNCLIPPQTPSVSDSDDRSADAEVTSVSSRLCGFEFSEGLHVVFNSLPFSRRSAILSEVMFARKMSLVNDDNVPYSRRMKALVHSVHQELSASAVEVCSVGSLGRSTGNVLPSVTVPPSGKRDDVSSSAQRTELNTYRSPQTPALPGQTVS